MAATSVIRAFAVGLWLGGMGGALAVWLILRQPAVSSAPHPAPASSGAGASTLQQENARLRAETRRLEETVSELKVLLEDLAAHAMASTDHEKRPVVDQLRLVRHWANALESDPLAADRLRALFQDSETDALTLRAAVEALARPPTNEVADLIARMNLLADLAELPRASEVSDALEAAQQELAGQWLAEAGQEGR